MEIRILGPIEAIDDEDHQVDLGGAKQQTLLALLAAHTDEYVSVDRCIDALWGEEASDGARHSLQTYVSNLRRALDPDRRELIETGRAGYRLNLDGGVTVDAVRFESLINASSPDLDQRLSDLEAALELWRGRPLGDNAEQSWALGVVARWEQLYLEAQSEYARLRIEAGESASVLADLQQLISQYPYHEPFRVHQVRALYVAHGQALALKAYSRYRDLIGEELGLEPGRELAELEDRILTGDPSLHPRPQVPNNLPADVSPLVGRQDEIAEVHRLLGETRLLTLYGSGGVGKTRLAISAARGILEDYPDGVWFVDLAPIARPDLVLLEIASCLDVEPPALRPLSEALKDYIGRKRILFVMDNCEHLIEAASSAATTLLTDSPNVSVLATSREIMQVPGETAWRVPSLPVEDQMKGSDSNGATAESTILFMERAMAAEPGFTLADETASSVNVICRRLDGIPLAIELAASKVRVLTPADLADRLTKEFDVLTSQGRDVLPRHRTLRATIEWSYQFAGETAQALFDTLGVFRGGFTTEAVLAVHDRPEGETISALEELIAKSLVTPVEGETHRFRLLETLRQYAMERLETQEATATVRDAHLNWVVVLCQENAHRLMTKEQLQYLDMFRTEMPNIRAALQWSVDSRQPEAGLRIASSLGRFWYLAARHKEGADWFDQLLSISDDVSPVVLGRGKTAATITLVRIGRWDEAKVLAREAVDLLEGTDSVRALGWAHYYLGVASVEPGYANIDEVAKQWSKARDLFDQSGDTPGFALATFLLYATRIKETPRPALEALLNETPDPAASGGPNLVAHVDEFTAFAHVHLGNYEEARQCLVNALRLQVKVRNWSCFGHAVECEAFYLVREGRPLDAARLLGANDTLRLSLSTVKAPYEDAYNPTLDDELSQALSTDDLTAAMQDGRAWSRDELVEKALSFLGADSAKQ